ncbi:MAG TPA: delta-60 repeat domain-containing protein [Pyrinomonadaceae bacterium]
MRKFLFPHVLSVVIGLFFIFNQSINAQSALDGFDPNPNWWVREITLQPDGKILVGGDFNSFSPNGGAAVARSKIARLNIDGTVDATLNMSVNSSFGGASIISIVLQPRDGKILVGGIFTSLAPVGSAPVTRNSIARLNGDGAVDMNFDPNANNTVATIAVQPDDKILIGGAFTSLAPNGSAPVTRNHIARLNADGSLDTSFNPNVNGGVNIIVPQPDGKILIGGIFTLLTPNGGAPVMRNNIARLNADGSVDMTFDPNANNQIYAIALQPDGKILIGGDFTWLQPNGPAWFIRNRIARLNADGSLDMTFDPNANYAVQSIVLQPDGKILIGGNFKMLAPSGSAESARYRRHNVARLNADGSLDMIFDPNFGGNPNNNYIWSIAVQPDGKILVGGIFGSLAPNGGASVTRNNIARLECDGRADQTLNNLNLLGIDGNFSHIHSTAIQPDGKIIIGGYFSSVLGTPRRNLARLNTDGTLDTTFNPNVNHDVYLIVVQPDGKILIGGLFTSLAPNGGATFARNRIARLSADGTIDATFNPNANNTVHSIAVQPDGKILVSGYFTSLAPNAGAAISRNYIARLNADGTVDAAFDPNPNNAVFTIATQPDGKILVGGSFTSLAPNNGASVTRYNLARLNTDGTVDLTFSPNPDDWVLSMTVQSDGRILIGGYFTSLSPNGGTTIERNHIARLNADGTVGTGFNPNVNDNVLVIVAQSDGKILIGGRFTSLAPNGGASVTRNRIARLNTNGTVDTTFNPNADSGVLSIALQPDGKILIGGSFTSLLPNNSAPVTRSQFARLSNNTVALSSLTVTRTAVTLARDGSAAQFTRVVFELSVDNGANYTLLGTATNGFTSPAGLTAAGEPAEGNGDAELVPIVPLLAPQIAVYTLNGLNLPSGQNILIRARGFYHTGFRGNSETIEDKVHNAFLPAPPPAPVSVSGRIFTADGDRLRNMRVIKTGATGSTRFF